MRQLLPVAADLDPLEVYVAARRPAPVGRPWIAVGMIGSLDGASTVDGRSGALGGPADTVVFRAVRAIADVILVGAGTVRAERYRRVHRSPEARAARERAGRTDDVPRLAIVSRSLDLDLGADCFAADAPPVTVFTTSDADAGRRELVSRIAEVHTAGEGAVEVAEVLRVLHEGGAEVVVSEGGPQLNGWLVAADVVDEWCLTISPTIAAGDSGRIVVGGGHLAELHRLRLESLFEADGLLFGRWIRTRSA